MKKELFMCWSLNLGAEQDKLVKRPAMIGVWAFEVVENFMLRSVLMGLRTGLNLSSELVILSLETACLEFTSFASWNTTLLLFMCELGRVTDIFAVVGVKALDFRLELGLVWARRGGELGLSCISI